MSALTGMRSAYFCRIRSASALRFSNGCSSLNLERISMFSLEEDDMDMGYGYCVVARLDDILE